MSFSHRHVRHRAPRRILAALTSAIVAACAQSGPTSVKEPAMNQPTQSATSSRCDPKAVGENLLNLISYIRSAADLTAERVERETGWTMHPSDSGGYRTGEALFAGHLRK